MTHPVHPDLLPAGVRAIELAPGMPGLAFSHPDFSAVLSLYGGQLLDFIPAGGQPLLYLSPQAQLQPGKAIRGGIPLCWPWFGPHPTDSSRPQHGVARTALWTVNAVVRSDDGFHVSLNGPREGELQASLTLLLAPQQLSLTLTTRNLGKTPQPLSQALHSYVAVSDIRQLRLLGLAQAPYHDKLDGQFKSWPDGDWTPQAATDAVVASAAPLQLDDAGWQRRLQLASSGSASTVVWTPWQQGAAKLADLPADGWQHFLCVEAANAGADARVLAAGEAHSLTQQLRVAAL